MHRFRDIAFDMPNVAIFGYLSCVLPPSERLLWDDLRKLLCGSQRMARLQYGVETVPKIGCVWCMNVTDDRQTELRLHIPGRNV